MIAELATPLPHNADGRRAHDRTVVLDGEACRRTEALAAAQEAVDLYRQARQIHGSVYDEDVSRVERLASESSRVVYGRPFLRYRPDPVPARAAGSASPDLLRQMLPTFMHTLSPYYPHWLLERRRRAERALTTVVATCYLLGVSTRRMERLVDAP